MALTESWRPYRSIGEPVLCQLKSASHIYGVYPQESIICGPW